ncbi:MAG: monovalent cation/hydrogen antiporter [Actinomycetota bacterium]|jgi:CPA1 family monovalent cation:H+ antiporter|nr:monovalent cation/hydrogen antiporter [Actinomycetota bacterium]
MSEALQILALVVAVAVVAAAARRLGFSAPLVLVVVGLVASLVPGVPDYRIDPDIVLIGFLPPLLYAAALRTSLVDVRANRQAIGIMAVGAVAFTTVLVGLVAWAVIPGVSPAGAFALGAVVSPPDAVAATTIARKVGMPRRIVAILEGESLLNDATALVALRTTTAAILASVSVLEVGGRFVLAAGGGIVVGLAMAAVLAMARKRVEDPVLDTTLSLVAPFLTYLAAEAVNASGVLAVVIVGLLLGHKAPALQSASSRLAEQTNWRTITFVLENAVFLLIGLQLRTVVQNATEGNLTSPRLAVICAVVLLATLLTRIVWVFGATAAYHYGTATMRANAWSWSAATLTSWAGMRGVVTLAAAFVLPEETPRRDVLILAAFAVVGGTLLVNGTTLPWLVRRLDLPGPDPAEDALEEAALLSKATRAGLARLDELKAEGDDPAVIERLEERARSRADAAWERLGAPSDDETPSESYRRLRQEMLHAERDVVLKARDSGKVDDEVLRDVMNLLDAEESLLDRLEDKGSTVERELVARTDRVGCQHLKEAPVSVRPNTPEGCEECLRDGTRWVHLRLCLTCGHVGCCDSSPERHASGHFHETGDPVMRSFETGEAWRWCYVDERLG